MIRSVHGRGTILGAMRSALLVLWLLAAAATLRAQCPDGTPPPCAGRVSSRTPVPSNSVAVLYFENQSTDSADRYLAAGLTEAIITRLGDLPRLVVKSRYLVRRISASDMDPVAVGRTLNVAYIVTGVVQHAGNRLRVTAEMARAASGDRVWGQQYDRGDGDVFAIQEDIARSVATGVAGRLLPGERSVLAARPTRNNEAYAALLRGDVFLAQRTPTSLLRALDEYVTATRLDSTFASAWGRIGVADALRLDWGFGDGSAPSDTILRNGLAASQRALALDSADSDAWLGFGYLQVFAHPHDMAGAEESMRRAVALNPRNAEAWHQLGDLLIMIANGHPRADSLSALAVAAYRQALTIDPSRPLTLRNLAQLVPALRLALVDSALALDPTNFLFVLAKGEMLLALGRDTAAAVGMIDRAATLAPDDARDYVEARRSSAHLLAGDSATARALIAGVLARLPAAGPLAVHPAADIAGVIGRLGLVDSAIAIMERVPPGVHTWTQADMGALPPALVHRFPRIRAIQDRSRPPWVPAPRDSTIH